MCRNNGCLEIMADKGDGCLSKHFKFGVLFGGLAYNQVPHYTMVSEIQLKPLNHPSAKLMLCS